MYFIAPKLEGLGGAARTLPNTTFTRVGNGAKTLRIELPDWSSGSRDEPPEVEYFSSNFLLLSCWLSTGRKQGGRKGRAEGNAGRKERKEEGRNA